MSDGSLAGSSSAKLTAPSSKRKKTSCRTDLLPACRGAAPAVGADTDPNILATSEIPGRFAPAGAFPLGHLRIGLAGNGSLTGGRGGQLTSPPSHEKRSKPLSLLAKVPRGLGCLLH